MKAKSTVLIWDWDGTLLYTRPAFEKAFAILNKEFPCSYFTPTNFELLLKNWGAFWEACPLPIAEKTKAMRFYGETYKQVNTSASFLMPQAQEVLSWAKENEYQQILVSNKVQWAIESEITHFGLTDYFSKVQGVEIGLHPDKKPSRSYGLQALEGIDYETAIVIGDSKDDITFAQNLSAKCLYLGNTIPSDFNGFKVASLAEVQSILQNMSAKQAQPNINLSRCQLDSHTH